jgi:hypothetical protein
MKDVDGWDKPGHDAIVLKNLDSGLDSGHFHHQIGQPFGGVEPADLAGG